MEIGEFKVFFVQYRDPDGRWFTKQPAFPTLEGAQDARFVPEMLHYITRVVCQTTVNRVLP